MTERRLWGTASPDSVPSLGPPAQVPVSSSRRRSRAHACGSTPCAGARAVPDHRQRRANPGLLLIRGIPGGERDTEWRRIRDALVGRNGVMDPSGCSKAVITRSSPARSRTDAAISVASASRRTAVRASRGAGDRVEAGRDERQCGAESECLCHRVASHPTAIGECLEDRVRGGLGQVEFAHHVGEPQSCVVARRLSNSTTSSTRSVGAELAPRNLDSSSAASYGHFSN